MWYNTSSCSNSSTKVYTVSAILNLVFTQVHMTENFMNMSITQIIFHDYYNYTNIIIVGT